jgi:hypothetical protein
MACVLQWAWYAPTSTQAVTLYVKSVSSQSGSARSVEKTEVQAEQEEDEMGDGARATNLWREDKVRTQERHRHFREIEIELDSPTDKERACQEFTEFSETVREVDCRQAPNDGCS